LPVDSGPIATTFLIIGVANIRQYNS